MNARTRDPRREQARVLYRDTNHPDGTPQWQPGTVVYQGHRLTIVALDNGTTHHVYDHQHELIELRADNGHSRVIEIAEHGTGQTGYLTTCHTCAGHGTLFVPDAAQPEITEQPPATHGLTPEDYRLLETIELARDRGGVYLLGEKADPWAHTYTRSDHGSWFRADQGRFSTISMGRLENAGLITVTTLSTDTELDTVPGKLFDAMHRDGDGRTEADWARLVLYRPEPTSDPYGKPAPEAMTEVLRAALDWLYKTEQPPGAMLSHHGIGSADLPTMPNRRIDIVPRGANGGPILNIGVSRPVKVGTYTVRNPLAPGELDQWAEQIIDLGYDVTQTFSGSEGSASGGIELAKLPHPSILAATKLRAQGCLTHPKKLGDREEGDVFCNCGWQTEPSRLLVLPAWPEPTP